MEEKKFNNAVEKAENISNDNVTQNLNSGEMNNSSNVSSDTLKVKNYDNGFNEQNYTHKTATVKSSNAKRKKSNGANKGKQKRDMTKEEKKQAYLVKKQQKEENRAKIRIEKAKLKKQKKEQRKQAKLEKSLQKKQNRENLKQLRLQKKEERLKRRDMLKNETKQQKIKRIQQEKRDKNQLKRQKREQRLQLRREKIIARRQRQEQRAIERQEKRKQRTSRGLGGWLAAVIALGCTVLVLTSILIWDVFMTNGGENMLSGVYAKSFYDLTGHIDNIDVNLGKLAISNDSENSQKILSDVVVQTSLASNNLQTLPLQDESRFNTIKFVNQLGDFSKYLNEKLIAGGELSNEDKTNIQTFKAVNGQLKGQLSELMISFDKDFSFVSMLTGEQDNIVLKAFKQLENNANEYPKIIYDGPFADIEQTTTDDQVIVQDTAITSEQALTKFNNYFADYDIKDAQLLGQAVTNDIVVYNISGSAMDKTLFAQISGKGNLVMFDWYMDCKDVNYSADECLQIANKFIEKCGYKNLKAVWTSQYQTSTFINFARVTNGVIIYSDMIKVNVCMERGMVYSIDAKSYILNYDKKRDIPKPLLTTQKAESKLNQNLTVTSSRLVIIPLRDDSERLCYEFYCDSNDGKYFVYIDAINGKELNIYKVVETREGILLL